MASLFIVVWIVVCVLLSFSPFAGVIWAIFDRRKEKKDLEKLDKDELDRY